MLKLELSSVYSQFDFTVREKKLEHHTKFSRHRIGSIIRK